MDEPSTLARRRFTAVLFTDIQGSTAYYHRSGDVAGRRLVRRHDDLLNPLVDTHGGRVVDHTGDGMLAVFGDPNRCARSAVAMQRAVAADNASAAGLADALHIRVAAHAGVALHEEGRVFGAVVNTAARVEALAEGDQILVSGSLYAHLDESLRRHCRFHEERVLRGTGEVHRIYELTWQAGAAVSVASAEAGAWLPTERLVDGHAARPAIAGLCTDLEGSGALGGLVGARYEELVADCVGRHGGKLQRVVGDTTSTTFVDAPSAAAAAVDIQRSFSGEPWDSLTPGGGAARVRVGIHVGDQTEAEAVVLERAARLNSAGHGGQILLTAMARESLGRHLPPGVGIRAHGNRILQDARYTETIFELVVADLAPSDPVLRTEPGRQPRRLLAAQANAPSRAPAEARADILAAIGGGPAAMLSHHEVRALAQGKPADLLQYRLGRVVEWSQPRFQLDSRFVHLTLLVDQGEQAQERWAASEQSVEDVSRLLDEVSQPAIVVLGPPGAGKSTILRRLELDVAVLGLEAPTSTPVTFLVPLSQFRPDPVSGTYPEPDGWLSDLWATRYPSLPSLASLTADGRMLFLLDGLNEMPTTGDDDYRRCVRLWKAFAERCLDRGAGNRLVFSCRSLDYSAPLSSPTLRVLQVRVDPMSDKQVRQYLKLYAPLRWAEIWEEIAGSRQLELFRSPFFLGLLLDQVEAEGRVPRGRAELFTGFVRQALRRELERDNPLFDDTQLVARRDRRQITGGHWPGPYALPERGLLFPLLERLAYGMQHAQGGTAATQVRVGLDVALDILEHERGEAALAAGAGLAVLDESTADDEILFTHQLVQEYFAARRMAVDLDLSAIAVPWRQADLGRSLREVVATLDTAEPLPPPPGSGWEETVILAVAMAPDPSALIARVADADLVLAGRSAAQPELDGRLDPALVGVLRTRLADRSRHVEADLRARIAAGLALGRLGGPVFERRSGPFGPYLVPPVVEVEGGEYAVGSEEPYSWLDQHQYEELPACTVTLAPFALGTFAVTNGEWSCFLDGGGYEDERFWSGEHAKAWLRGEGTVVNIRTMARYWWRRFLEAPELLELEYQDDRMDRSMYELWHRRLGMTDEDFERHLAEEHPGGRLREPRFWRDPRFSNLMQPVIGISCFEAGAYCRWLADQSGQPYRLPTEVEWEVAARGPARRTYAYGDSFDPVRSNTVETHVRAPTPVGVFPEGDTPEGIADLTGNTFDLTASLWGEDPIRTTWPYPYDPDDGREGQDAPVTVSRVGKGGCWYLGQVHARAAYRGRDRFDLRADEWLNFRGCRVALSLSQ